MEVIPDLRPATAVALSGGGQVSFFAGYSVLNAAYRACLDRRATHFAFNSGASWFGAAFMYSPKLGPGLASSTQSLSKLVAEYAVQYNKLLERITEGSPKAEDNIIFRFFALLRQFFVFSARGYNVGTGNVFTCDDVQVKIDDMMQVAGLFLSGHATWLTFNNAMLMLHVPDASELHFSSRRPVLPNASYVFQLSLPPSAWLSGPGDQATEHVCARMKPSAAQLATGVTNKTFMPLALAHDAGGRSSYMYGGLDGEFNIQGMKRRPKGARPCPGYTTHTTYWKKCTSRDTEETALRCMEGIYPDDSSLVSGDVPLLHSDGGVDYAASDTANAQMLPNDPLVSSIVAGSSSLIGWVGTPTLLGGLFPHGLYPTRTAEATGLRRFMKCMPGGLQYFAAPVFGGKKLTTELVDSYKGRSVAFDVQELNQGGYRYVDGIFTDNLGMAYAASHMQIQCSQQKDTACQPFMTMVLLDAADYVSYKDSKTIAPTVGSAFQESGLAFDSDDPVGVTPMGGAMGVDYLGMTPQTAFLQGAMPKKSSWYEETWVRFLQYAVKTVTNPWYGVAGEADVCLLLVEFQWMRPMMVASLGPVFVSRRMDAWFGDSSEATSDELYDIFDRFFAAIDWVQPAFDPKNQFDRCRLKVRG